MDALHCSNLPDPILDGTSGELGQDSSEAGDRPGAALVAMHHEGIVSPPPLAGPVGDHGDSETSGH